MLTDTKNWQVNENNGILQEAKQTRRNTGDPSSKKASSKEATEDGEAEDNEPNDMEEKEGLAGDEAAPAVADLAGSPLRDADAGARRLRAPAPVRDAVHAADGVRPEAIDAARGGYPVRYSTAEIDGVGVGGVKVLGTSGGYEETKEG